MGDCLSNQPTREGLEYIYIYIYTGPEQTSLRDHSAMISSILINKIYLLYTTLHVFYRLLAVIIYPAVD